MTRLSDESFICQNCKTPLSHQDSYLWVKLGKECTCRECGNKDFDMYPAITPHEEQTGSWDNVIHSFLSTSKV